MKILVTGGAGFIGSNLIRLIVDEWPHATIVNLDALTYAGTLTSLSDVIGHPRHRFVEGDICDAELVAEHMRGVDLVLHLAAESHVDRSIVSDAPFVRTYVMGTATLLGSALAAGVGRFVQVSTDEVYGELPWRDPEDGDPDPVRFTEATPLAPRSPYSATKAAGDHLALAYHSTHGMDVVVTRCSNNYGPYQFPEKLIPLMIANATDDQPLPVYGDGMYVRDWIHVLDHCHGLLAAAKRGQPGRVYNFGGDAERANLRVVERILASFGRGTDRIEYVTDRPGHDRRYAVDSARSRRELDWRPRVAFEAGLEQTIEWYRANEAWWRPLQERNREAPARP